MEISISEKIRIIMRRNKLTTAELARRTGQSPQNLSNKLSRDNFTTAELDKIAQALGCSLSILFCFQDGTQI